MSKAFRLLGVLIAAALLLAAYYTYAPRHTPSGQPPLETLDAGNFPELPKAFNDAADRTRILLLLSPT